MQSPWGEIPTGGRSSQHTWNEAVSALAYRAREGLRQAYLTNHATADPTAAALNADRQMQPHMLVRRSIALVLAGGRGSRLKQLTDRRAKPAVYFGGKFRIVDFALSNCMNSGIRRIGVITQYKSHSLLRHLQRGWAFLKSEMNEFVDLLPAQQRTDDESWYRGTADAVYQNQDILAAYGADYIVVLAGDHIYKMNYALMLADHVALGAEVTMITTSPGKGEDAPARAASVSKYAWSNWRRSLGELAMDVMGAPPHKWCSAPFISNQLPWCTKITMTEPLASASV